MQSHGSHDHTDSHMSRIDSDQPKLRLPIYTGKSTWEASWVQFELWSEKFHWGPRIQSEQFILSLLLYLNYPIMYGEIFITFSQLLNVVFGRNMLPQTERAQLQSIRTRKCTEGKADSLI